MEHLLENKTLQDVLHHLQNNTGLLGVVPAIFGLITAVIGLITAVVSRAKVVDAKITSDVGRSHDVVSGSGNRPGLGRRFMKLIFCGILLFVGLCVLRNLEPNVLDAIAKWVAIPASVVMITGAYQFAAIVLVICWRALKFLFG